MSNEDGARPHDSQLDAQAIDTVGDLVAHVLAELGVTTVFGVISIHNMPILDAIARQRRLTFVPARGEAGALNMADAYARVSRSLGVAITSTGTAAGNAAGSQVEALTAGSPVLHITTQVDRMFMDRDRAAIHDVPRQGDMLRAISKAYLRAWEPSGVGDALVAAARTALAAPSGPVTFEIPIDVQRAPCAFATRAWLSSTPKQMPAEADLDLLAARVRAARRPLLWLGGGARGAQEAATALAERGFAVVTSTNGRAVVAEDHPHSLGAFNMTPAAERIYAASDLMIVVGSRLRGNETHNNLMVLPPLVQIDVDPTQASRNYPVEQFVQGDAALVLGGLLARLGDARVGEVGFLSEVRAARAESENRLRDTLGPYGAVADALNARVGGQALCWVRDVTISNSTFGNRYVRLAAPHLGVHALGGGIGQGIAMAIGAALAAAAPKTVALIGDGGSQLMIGELATAVEVQAEVVFVLMNDRGYGVIRNIQDAQYGGRHVFSNILTPDFSLLCAAVGLAHERIGRAADFGPVLDGALARRGPHMIEVDMTAIGPFAKQFAGPPAGAAGKAA